MKPKLLIIFTLALTLPTFAEDNDDATAIRKKPDLHAVFVKRDKDKDGFLSKEEFVGKPKDLAKAEAAFAKKDKNKDGELSLKEFAGKKFQLAE